MTFGGVNHDLEENGMSAAQTVCRALHHTELFGRVPKLTDRQAEILDMSEEGFLDKEIASDLGITISAVAQHKRAICNVFGLTSFRSASQIYSVYKWGSIVPTR